MLSAPLGGFLGWGLAARWWEGGWPAGAAERMGVLGGLLLGAVWLSRWLGWGWWGVAVTWAAAWWLAGSVGVAEFWRVLFGGWAAVWLLRRQDGAAPVRALGVGLTVWGGVLAGGVGGVWPGMAAVLPAVATGCLAGGRGGVVLPVVSMAGVAGVAIGAGRGMGMAASVVDLACLVAIAAPWLSGRAGGWVSQRVPWRVRRVGPVAGAVLVAAGLVGAAWMGARVLVRLSEG